jgi:TonB family protein
MTTSRPGGSLLFSSLPSWRAPWRDFFVSYGTQAIVVAIFVWIPILHPEILEQPAKDYHAMELVPTPVPVNLEPQRQLPRHVLVAKIDPVDPPPAAMRLPAAQPRVRPKVEDTPAPEVKIQEKKPDLIPTATPVIPKTIKTNVFSTGSSAPQTLDRAPAKVETGGFGDPNGVAARQQPARIAVNIAQSGGFDMPTGPGVGNGTGGANGARGVVASAGFGGGTAIGSAHPATASGTVHSAGFGDADVAAPPTVQSHAAAAAATRVIPAEILSKPTPVYTAEARAQRIEGEVLLEVVFEASGRLRVTKVVRGLGHGLDDAAIQAAEQIRFKPAMKDGLPSDSTAVVHIIFQLA